MSTTPGKDNDMLTPELKTTTTEDDLDIRPATSDAAELLCLAIDAAAGEIAAELPNTRYGSPTEVTDGDVRRHAGATIPVLMAMLHIDATPAVEVLRVATQTIVSAR